LHAVHPYILRHCETCACIVHVHRRSKWLRIAVRRSRVNSVQVPKICADCIVPLCPVARIKVEGWGKESKEDQQLNRARGVQVVRLILYLHCQR